MIHKAMETRVAVLRRLQTHWISHWSASKLDFHPAVSLLAPASTLVTSGSNLSRFILTE